MADNYSYSRPYAEAAFKMALEDEVINMWSDDLKTLAIVIADKDIKAILSDPNIQLESSAKLLMAFLADSNNLKIKNYISLLLENKRIFDNLKSSHNNIRIVEVETSLKLSPSQTQSLIDLFRSKYKSEIEIEEKINPNLLEFLRPTTL